MENKQKIIIPTVLLIILAIFIPLILNKLDYLNKLNKATNFLKYKINSESKHYMKSIAYGDVSQCGNCNDGSRGAPVYAFFISQAIGSKLDNKEINILLSKIDTNGDSLWGYDGKSKIKEWNDSDDTAFSMRALEYFNKQYNLNDINYFYDEKSQTFKSFNNNSIMINYPDNFNAHPEVNANIYNLLEETRQKNNFNINTEFINKSQNEDGSFNTFYYPSKYYSSYMFLSFLCKSKDKKLYDITNKAINFVLNTQNIDGSWGDYNGNNYDTALALASLKTCNINNSKTKKAKKLLLKNQNQDGSWDANEIFWTFHLDKNTYWNTYINSILTTSIAVIALK